MEEKGDLGGEAMGRVSPLIVAALVLAVGGFGCSALRPGCDGVAGAANVLHSVEPVRSQSLAAVIGEMPMQGEDIVRRHLASGPESSVFLIRIGGGEEPHRHARYDLTVVVVEGEGTLWLDGEPLAMRPGDIAHIPRGVPHHFVNSGTVPASAIGVFSPRFTGPDIEAVD